MVTLEKLRFTRKDGDSERLILDSIDHQFAAGAQVALTGDSGAGKTTLLRLIGALEPLQQGEIQVAGKPLSQLNPAERARQRRSQGMVFQDCRLLSTLSARDNILLSYQLAGGQGQPPLLPQLLEQLNIGHVIDRLPQSLSGGEQQRVAIARALIHRPALVLADEPTGNLDSDAADNVCQLLQQLCHQQNATLIMVTHSLRLAKRFESQWQLRNGSLNAVAGA
ncbi:ABC transporter ATP-binding protein [Ferrimonas senticii]|uniref:ABC transporter ATP-binding protein n=1 Tax=Ferrimonas senticii TaxID=394566 RepID=UPI00040DAEA6|nr:ATP-binding cassette domain-containing protein [Ferrimonas senticii]